MELIGLSDTTRRSAQKAAAVMPALSAEQRVRLIQMLCEVAYAEGAAHAGALIAAGITARTTVERARSA